MSAVNVLFTIWMVVTAIFAALMIWKSLVSMREETVVFIDPAEAAQADEKSRISARVDRLAIFAKSFGIASVTLLLVSGGLWLYQGFNAGL